MTESRNVMLDWLVDMGHRAEGELNHKLGKPDSSGIPSRIESAKLVDG